MHSLTKGVSLRVHISFCCFLDTEGSFIVERVAEIAMASIQHIASVAEKDQKDLGMLGLWTNRQSVVLYYADLKRCAEEFTLDKVLGGIHYFRCHDYVELVALVNILPQFIAQHPKVRQCSEMSTRHLPR